jgi:RHS repeat-associated protein
LTPPVEVLSSACTTKRYYSLGSTVVAVRDTATTQLTYLLGDQLGSTTVSVNAAGGTPVVQHYLPYGAPRSTSGTPVTDRGWIGQTKDSSTGLQYLNARYYDPAVGRFTATGGRTPCPTASSAVKSTATRSNCRSTSPSAPVRYSISPGT